MWITKGYINSLFSKWKVSEIGMLQAFLIEKEEDLSQTLSLSDRWAKIAVKFKCLNMKLHFPASEVTIGENWDPLTRYIRKTSIFTRHCFFLRMLLLKTTFAAFEKEVVAFWCSH